MIKKVTMLCLLVLFLLSSFMPTPAHAGGAPWWNKAWSYRQNIFIPIDTSVSLATYQPIDTTVVFEHPCWATDEQHYSVRVIAQSDNPPEELESQVYGLNHTDATHIASCNLVFLIPPNTTGSEQYYIYYDGSETPAPAYRDHVNITDAYSEYEPIPGYKMTSHYYKISQGDFYVYTVTQDAYLLWYTGGQLVSKAVPGATEILPKNEDMTASFDFAYYYGPEASQMNSTSEYLISKQILVDGNLMVCCQLQSRSKGDDLETTAVYKYYYSPGSQKRIEAHIVDTALKDCHVYPGTDTDGSYVTVQSARLSSSSVEDLNGGQIFPFLHVYTEANTVEEYPIDLTPESNPNQRTFSLITATDDVDLGPQAWACLDEGTTTGAVHALLFRSTSVVKAGTNERDGIQLKAFESGYPHVPGLTHDAAGFECTRNTYEAGDGPRNLLIPKGFRAEFDAEFFSSSAGGYQLVEQEVPLYRARANITPSPLSNASMQEEAQGKNSLTVVVRQTPAFPFGAVLSILTGRNFPFINVEVYKKDEQLSSGTAGRLPLGQISGSSTTMIGKLVAVAQVLNLRNLSLFKKITFQYLEPGEYLVKVFRDNSFIGKEHQFIGYKLVDLSQNQTIQIRCHWQGKADVHLADEQGRGIGGAEVVLSDGTTVIAQNITDQQGNARLFAPCGIGRQYTLQIFDQGFLVDNEQVKFHVFRTVFPLHRSLQLSEYDWQFTLVDTWGLPLAVSITPQLSSDAMKQPVVLSPSEHGPNNYLFTQLLPASYHLRLQYKSFRLDENITIPAAETSYIFPVTFPVTFHVVDTRGLGVSDGTFLVNRSGKSLVRSLNDSTALVSLPPGDYAVSVVSHDTVISKRPVTVTSERSVELISTQEPWYPLIVILSFLVIGIFAMVYSVMKRNLMMGLVSLAVCLTVVACMLPWWSLAGNTPQVTTSSTLYLVPPTFVTTTTTASVLTGELATLPDMFSIVIMVLLVVIVAGCLLCCVSLLLQRMQRPRMQLISVVGAILLLASALAVFLVAMTLYSEVSVGSILGAGVVEVSVPGMSDQVSIPCNWGPASGFVVFVLAFVLLLAALILWMPKRDNKK
ncbi:MAG TPA: hypothetical protein VMT57_01820 [Candidatus Thermoplasmatota archaeon]|nr:hypothetical protein [Candidatus Thermoplasmatota archaeon]